MATNKDTENKNTTTNTLAGYVRMSNSGGAIKLSINLDALKECDTYESKNGETFVPLIINKNGLNSVMSGERPVTTVNQLR